MQRSINHEKVYIHALFQLVERSKPQRDRAGTPEVIAAIEKMFYSEEASNG
jgi:hypothetical protein